MLFCVVIETDYNRFTYIVVATSASEALSLAEEKHKSGVFGKADISKKTINEVDLTKLEVLTCEINTKPRNVVNGIASNTDSVK